MKSARILVWGMLLSLLAFALPYLLGLRQTELAITGICLCAMSLGLVLNRVDAIAQVAIAQPSQRDCRHLLVTTILSSVCLFLGCWISLTLLMLIVSDSDLSRTFAFVAEYQAITAGNLGQGQFAALAEILPHNLGVMATVTVLSIVYGNFGLSFSLTWNITLWTAILVPLVARTVAASSNAGLAAFFVSNLAIAPHVLIEFLAYLQAGLAAVHTRNAFLVDRGSRAITAIRLRCLLAALAAGAMLLTAAAWFESQFAGAVLRFLPAG